MAFLLGAVYPGDAVPGFCVAVLVTGAQRAFAFFERGVAMEQSSPRFTHSVSNVPLCIFEDGSGTRGMPQSSCTIWVNVVGWRLRLGCSFSWVHRWVGGTQGHRGTPRDTRTLPTLLFSYSAHLRCAEPMFLTA